MMNIFSSLGTILGYVLFFFYSLVHNYGLAIILFTVVVSALMFPLYAKQQKTAASSAKLSKKVKEIQTIYANDKAKQAQETQKLYDKEGVNPMSCGGCVTMLVPMLIFMGLYWSIGQPLTNTLHLDQNAVNTATAFLDTLPGNVLPSDSGSYGGIYRQLDIAKHFDVIAPYIQGMFSEADFSKLEMFSRSFNFMGMNLLDTPAYASNFLGSLFRGPLWLLPLGSVALNIFSMLYQQIGSKKQGQMQQNMGCMTVGMIVMQLFFVYITCILPAAMGLYYLTSGLMNLIRTWAMLHYFSPQRITAKLEGSHVLRLEQQEAAMQPLPANVQQQLEAKVRNWNQNSPNGAARSKEKQGGQKPQKAVSKPQNKTGYMGKKK